MRMLNRIAAAIKLPIGGFQVLMDPPSYKWVAVGIRVDHATKLPDCRLLGSSARAMSWLRA
jgi:hypothetical protein